MCLITKATPIISVDCKCCVKKLKSNSFLQEFVIIDNFGLGGEHTATHTQAQTYICTYMHKQTYKLTYVHAHAFTH